MKPVITVTIDIQDDIYVATADIKFPRSCGTRIFQCSGFTILQVKIQIESMIAVWKGATILDNLPNVLKGEYTIKYVEIFDEFKTPLSRELILDLENNEQVNVHKKFPG